MLRGDVPPNQTIYVNNINEKVKKEELKKSLYAVFSQFGRILDIVALKTLKLRGQAWVVFDDVTSATNALRQMQGFPFYDKPMRIAYAKAKSDVITKADGTFEPRDKKKKGKKQTAEGPPQTATVKPAPVEPPSVAEKYGAPTQPGETPFVPSFHLSVSETAPPNNTLFVQNLPPETTNHILSMLFQQFPGFQEVRTVDTRPGIAFVEFSDESQATVALQGLHGFHISPTRPMHITYAKK